MRAYIRLERNLKSLNCFAIILLVAYRKRKLYYFGGNNDEMKKSLFIFCE